MAALLAVLISGTGWLAWERLGPSTVKASAGLERVDVPSASDALVSSGASGGGSRATGADVGSGGAPRPRSGDGGAAGGEEAPAGSGGDGTKIMRVHVAGAVRNPGVYTLPPGSRVVDAIAAAGGRRSDAREDVLNLAAPLADGDKVYVPNAAEVVRALSGQDRAGGGWSAGGGNTGGEAGARDGWAGSGGLAGGATGGRVDVNRADARALEALPGVGPSLAAAIVRYRQEHGAFRSLAELEKVPGIGPAKLAAIRDLVIFH